MFTVAIRAYRCRHVAILDGQSMDAVAEFVRYVRMALRTCLRDVRFRYARQRIRSLLHLMTAVAIDAVRRFSIATVQRRAVNASFICRDESCRRRHRSLHIRIIKVACEAEFLLGNLQFGGVLRRRDVSYRVSMTFDATRSSFDACNLRMPVRRKCEGRSDISMA